MCLLMKESRRPNEQELELLRQGDLDGLARLFSRHRDRLWRMVHFRLDPRLQGRVDADDILQEAYLAASTRLGHIFDESPSSVFIWLRLIVNQTLIDVHRRHLGTRMRDAGREISLDAGRYTLAASSSVALQLAGSLTSPSRALLREEACRQLEEALLEMDPVDREVLVLRHFEELTNSEVAEVLGIQQKAASIRYVRALGRLKKVLTRLEDFRDSGKNLP
jgi:RNA polymerase sigma-70 factor (ECF subfamily)